MKPECEWVFQKRKVLLYKWMCEDAGIECSDLFNSMVNGASLVGQAPCSALFQAETTQP
jgi:hypothetical protein